MSNMTDYQRLIAASRYARWREEDGRREFWDETVARYAHYWADKGLIDTKMARRIQEAVEGLEVMPSMRALWTAGPALDRDNVAGYNCAFLSVDDPRAFDEALYVLCCGTGLGFSVERQEIAKLPDVAEEFHDTDTTIVVADSKVGWAKAYRQLIAMLYAGEIPKHDVSRVREAGARLKVFGGRASGPAPLVDLFEFTTRIFKGAAGRKLNSLECHDLMTKIGEIVVVGGVRRSAMISLSNVSDDRMRKAKSGQWWTDHGQRALANNSAAYTERPDFQVFQDEMRSLYDSFSGERGIFNREAAKLKTAKYGRRDPSQIMGVNPCAEILLRSGQMCNLTEVVIRPNDSLDDLLAKVELAAIMGTLQSTLTNFRYLRSKWKNNCEEERLLGVSFTGICDHPVLSKVSSEARDWLSFLREYAVQVNAKWADKLGVQHSAAITTVKPSGTVSQLVDSASGIHPRYSPYYVRTIRQDNKDPMTDFLIAQGVPHEPCVMKPDTTTVFAFPVKSPDCALTVDDVGTIDQLELAKMYGECWAEHTVSLTAYYTDSSWFDLCSWAYNNWDHMIGMSFLPHDGGTYKQAPYQAIDSYKYEILVEEMPVINWDELPKYERGDTTEGAKTMACVGSSCEIS
tara:strand:+ start:2144 stop:4030 length:1887 start_codon:yes stop_codon:yes gene_type:complete